MQWAQVKYLPRLIKETSDKTPILLAILFKVSKQMEANYCNEGQLIFKFFGVFNSSKERTKTS